MLILTRKPGESIIIGDDIKITVVEQKGHQIRLGIDAPRKYRIYREEIYLQILEENRSAAAAAVTPNEMESLEGLTDVWKGKGGKTKSGFSSLKSSSAGTGDKKDVEVVVKRRRQKKDDK